MTDQQITEPTIICPICGRCFAQDEMVWSEQDEQPLCPNCQSEEENCGCADD